MRKIWARLYFFPLCGIYVHDLHKIVLISSMRNICARFAQDCTYFSNAQYMCKIFRIRFLYVGFAIYWPETYITAMISQINWKDSYLNHGKLGRIGQIEEKVQSCTHLGHWWMKCNLVHILCYPESKPSGDRSTVEPQYLQYSFNSNLLPIWTICSFPETWLTLVLPLITQIDFHLQWVFEILTLTCIMLHISCRLREEL